MARKESRITLVAKPDNDGAEKVISRTPTIGVLAGLSGANQDTLAPTWERSFEKISPGKFDKLFQSFKPRVAFTTPDPLAKDKDTTRKMNVDITFQSMQSFEPDSVAESVPVLKKLMEARDRLQQFKAKADGRFKLQGLINEALKDQELADLLREEETE